MNADERAVLAHVVVDPDAWEQHAIETFGAARAAQMLSEKVARWKLAYKAAAVSPNYKPRAERPDEKPAELP
jgi:hypothetical protein